MVIALNNPKFGNLIGQYIVIWNYKSFGEILNFFNFTSVSVEALLRYWHFLQFSKGCNFFSVYTGSYGIAFSEKRGSRPFIWATVEVSSIKITEFTEISKSVKKVRKFAKRPQL